MSTLNESVSGSTAISPPFSTRTANGAFTSQPLYSSLGSTSAAPGNTAMPAASVLTMALPAVCGTQAGGLATNSSTLASATGLPVANSVTQTRVS